MAYDPFIRGRYSVAVRTLEAQDAVRKLRFTCELWYPANEAHFGQDYAEVKFDEYTLPGGTERRMQRAVRDAAAADGRHPLILYSHGSSRWRRREATYLCTHLASHGYVVAALDHYETLVPDATNEKVAQNRVADIAFLLDFMLGPKAPRDLSVEPSRVSAVGHSLGGWTVIAAMESEERIRALVPIAPAASARPRPGIFSGKLRYKWKREAPTLLLSAQNDVITPLAGMREIFKRLPKPKRAFVLKHADHIHFLDDVEEEHEAVRAAERPEEMQWINDEMRPVSELISGETGREFTRGLTLGHLDATLLWLHDARTWYAGNMKADFAERKIDGVETGRVLS